MTLAKISILLLVYASSSVFAQSVQISGKKISKIRAVADYSGTTYDNTVELWFTNAITWPAGINCTNIGRVEIDAKNTHLISAAYMALAAGKTVNFYADDQLTVRNGTCEISYLDVIN